MRNWMSLTELVEDSRFVDGVSIWHKGEPQYPANRSAYSGEGRAYMTVRRHRLAWINADEFYISKYLSGMEFTFDPPEPPPLSVLDAAKAMVNYLIDKGDGYYTMRDPAARKVWDDLVIAAFPKENYDDARDFI